VAVVTQPARAGAACCNSAILNSLSSDGADGGPLERAGVVAHMAEHHPDVPPQITDPDAMKMPADWDEEDDGPWKTLMVANPAYLAKAAEVALQHFAPSMTEQVLANLQTPAKIQAFAANARTSLYGACPWLVLGLLCTAAMQALMAAMPSLTALVSLEPAPQAGDSAAAKLRLCAKGAALGLATPLCSCGTLPMALSLAQKGASPPAVVSFVTAAQSAGLDSLTFTLGILGAKLAAARMVGAAALAVAAGLAAGFGFDLQSGGGRGAGQEAGDAEGQGQEKEQAQEQCVGTGCCTAGSTPAPAAVAPPAQRASASSDCAPTARKGGAAAVVLVALRQLLSQFEEIGLAIAVGMAATSAITLFVPMHLLWGSDTAAVTGRFVILGAALPLQMCEHSVVAFAVALQEAGASPGTAFAFLLSAPASNVATLSLVLRRAGGARAAVQSGAAVVATAVSISYAADALGANLVAQGSASDAFPEWYVQGSTWAVAALAAVSCVKFLVERAAGLALAMADSNPDEVRAMLATGAAAKTKAE
jgi:uncharacterized membrane protein YraQ (UPF0718 family)